MDAKDTESLWYAAQILEVRSVGDAKWVFVTFDEWSGDKFGRFSLLGLIFLAFFRTDEWFHYHSPSLAQYKSKSKLRVEYQVGALCSTLRAR